MSQRSHSMRSHGIACDRMQSHAIANLMSTTVRVLENASGTRSGTESLPKCFFTTTVNRFHIIFFAFLKKEEMRSGTHFTQQNVFLLFTVVVTKHVWPYFQSRFPKTSSERVSSRGEWKPNHNCQLLQQEVVNFIENCLESSIYTKNSICLFWSNSSHQKS